MKGLKILIVVLMVILVIVTYQNFSGFNAMKKDIAQYNAESDEYRMFAALGRLGSTHTHSTFKVFVDGKELDFAKEEYMVKAPSVHIEEMIGDVIHVHATGITLGQFFRSLGMSLSDCFYIKDKGYCDEGDKMLKVVINGQLIHPFLAKDYELKEDDKILVSYGNEGEEELKRQFLSIRDVPEDARDKDDEEDEHDE